VFEELECIRNSRSCAISEARGCVQLKNFKAIESGKTLIEVYQANEAKWDTFRFMTDNSKVIGGIFVGRTT